MPAACRAATGAKSGPQPCNDRQSHEARKPLAHIFGQYLGQKRQLARVHAWAMQFSRAQECVGAPALRRSGQRRPHETRPWLRGHGHPAPDRVNVQSLRLFLPCLFALYLHRWYHTTTALRGMGTKRWARDALVSSRGSMPSLRRRISHASVLMLRAPSVAPVRSVEERQRTRRKRGGLAQG